MRRPLAASTPLLFGQKNAVPNAPAANTPPMTRAATETVRSLSYELLSDEMRRTCRRAGVRRPVPNRVLAPGSRAPLKPRHSTCHSARSGAGAQRRSGARRDVTGETRTAESRPRRLLGQRPQHCLGFRQLPPGPRSSNLRASPSCRPSHQRGSPPSRLPCRRALERRRRRADRTRRRRLHCRRRCLLRLLHRLPLGTHLPPPHRRSGCPPVRPHHSCPRLPIPPLRY